MLDLPMDAIGGGVSRGDNWHTPHGQANVDHTGKVGGGGELDMQVRQWPTPASNPPSYNKEYLDVNGGPVEPGQKSYDPETGRKLQSDLGLQVRQWQTPSSGNFRTRGGDRADELGLDNQVKNWSTPTDDDGNNATRESGQFKLLTRDVHQWGTPRADEYKGCGPKGCAAQKYRLEKHYLDSQVEEIEAKGQQLNPEWESLLMGWPAGWTDAENPCVDEFPGWPAGQGPFQYDYEPPRTVPRGTCPNRVARVKCIGNGVVPQCATVAYLAILLELLQPRR